MLRVAAAAKVRQQQGGSEGDAARVAVMATATSRRSLRGVWSRTAARKLPRKPAAPPIQFRPAQSCLDLDGKSTGVVYESLSHQRNCFFCSLRLSITLYCVFVCWNIRHAVTATATAAASAAATATATSAATAMVMTTRTAAQ